MATVEELLVFVAFPDDAKDEAHLVVGVLEDLNAMLRWSRLPFRLAIRWWHDVPPGMHKGGIQQKIDSEAELEACDFFVGIFGARFGIPRPELSEHTPTEHEVRTALRGWKLNKKPQILLYFDQDPASRSGAEAEQMSKLQAFKGEMQREPDCLLKSYSRDKFQSLARVALWAHTMEHARATAPVTWIGFGEALFLRATGITERLGDLILAPSAATPPSANRATRFDIQIYSQPSIAITNWHRDDGYTDAVLVTEEFDRTANRPVYGRKLLGQNTLIFENVEIDTSFNCRIRIANVRVNASQMGCAEGSATISLVALARPHNDSDSGVPITLAPPLGRIAGPSFGFQTIGPRELDVADAPVSGQQGVQSSSRITHFLVFSEECLAAFKAQAEENNDLGDWPERSWPLGGGHTLTCTPFVTGTRFLVRFASVPVGFRIFVTRTDVAGNSNEVSEELLLKRAHLVPSANPNGAWGGLYRGSGPLVELMPDGGAAQATWEWVAPRGNSFKPRSVIFGVLVDWMGGRVQPGTCVVNGTLGPISTTASGAKDQPVPRFIDNVFNRILFQVRRIDSNPLSGSE